MELAGEKILVVEDEMPLLRAIVARLKLAGLDPVPVSLGKEAIDMLKKETFDAVILDLMLPDIDGFDILVKINEMKFKMPVVVVTALSQPEDKRRAFALGAADYMNKGEISLGDIAGEIKDLLEKQNKT